MPVLQFEMCLTTQHGRCFGRLILIYVTDVKKFLIVETINVKLKLNCTFSSFLELASGVTVVARDALFLQSTY